MFQTRTKIIDDLYSHCHRLSSPDDGFPVNFNVSEEPRTAHNASGQQGNGQGVAEHDVQDSGGVELGSVSEQACGHTLFPTEKTPEKGMESSLV